MLGLVNALKSAKPYVSSLVGRLKSATTNNFQIDLSKPHEANAQTMPKTAPMAQNEPVMGNLNVRGVDITPQDMDELRRILFSEVSNRSKDKQLLELQTITNTALNRVPQYNARGKQMTLADVLKMPNQYQGYNSSEYKKVLEGNLDEPSKQKLAVIDEFLKGLAELEDNTNNSVFYKHAPDGKIFYEEGPLFK